MPFRRTVIDGRPLHELMRAPALTHCCGAISSSSQYKPTPNGLALLLHMSSGIVNHRLQWRSRM
jgi:hypothetical protein